MPNDLTNAYLRNKVLSASPEELRLMLLDGCLRFCRQGREGLAARNFEQSFNGLSAAKNILVELVTGMNRDANPELCDRLAALYMFLYRRLIDANLEKNPAIVDEVIALIEYERETWAMTMAKIAQERGQPVPAAALAALGSDNPRQPQPQPAAQATSPRQHADTPPAFVAQG